MSEPDFDFIKIWTQSDEVSEFRMKTVLLDGLDSVVQGQCDVLSKIKVDEPVANPVVHWLEERGYPSTITAQLTGNNMVFSGYLFGQIVDEESLGKVIREGTILERKELPTQGRYQRWLISFQAYGLVARNPRANIGMIYGLPQ